MAIYLIAFIILFFVELLYFKIADKYNIIDKPNQRSSHTQITLRGGGIIFPIAAITGITVFQPDDIYLIMAIFLIASISFLDDIITLNNKLRIAVHFLSVALVLYQIYISNLYSDLASVTLIDSTLSMSLFLVVCSFILVIGIINAYNFMDGINGITVLYSLAAMCTLLYIQEYLGWALLEKDIYILVIVSLLVFGFFNLRKRAKAFSGDVGSISIALLICYLICQLILVTGEIKWLFLLGVYGLDSVATICCRIVRKENIFEAHRSHLYQYLVNEKKLGHISVAVIFTGVQLLLNLVIIYSGILETGFFFLCIFLVYILYRLKNEGYTRLFVEYKKRVAEGMVLQES